MAELKIPKGLTNFIQKSFCVKARPYVPGVSQEHFKIDLSQQYIPLCSVVPILNRNQRATAALDSFITGTGDNPIFSVTNFVLPFGVPIFKPCHSASSAFTYMANRSRVTKVSLPNDKTYIGGTGCLMEEGGDILYLLTGEHKWYLRDLTNWKVYVDKIKMHIHPKVFSSSSSICKNFVKYLIPLFTDKTIDFNPISNEGIYNPGTVYKSSDSREDFVNRVSIVIEDPTPLYKFQVPRPQGSLKGLSKRLNVDTIVNNILH